VRVDTGSRSPFRWRAAWPALTLVVVVAGVLAIVVRLIGASDGSAAPPVAVITAPVSTAATPSEAARARGLQAPELGTTMRTRRIGCLRVRPLVLRVLQFNIRAGISGTGVVDAAQIAREIEEVRPDLVSLNEVDSNTLRTRLDEPAYLARATGLHVVYGPNLLYDGGRFGNAILTRYPVLESHNLRLPGAFGLEPRGLLTAIVRIDGRRVAFSSTHLSDGTDGGPSRILQALVVARAVHSTAGPAIVAGDLNSVPTDLPERILRQHLLDAQENGGTGVGDTIPEGDPGSRFDYVLYDRHFAVVPGSTRVRASASSDHRSVFTKLTLLRRHGC
jgi:endonuclease/exonuclease/phosphatase family metal-dependent hydrolase